MTRAKHMKRFYDIKLFYISYVYALLNKIAAILLRTFHLSSYMRLICKFSSSYFFSILLSVIYLLHKVSWGVSSTFFERVGIITTIINVITFIFIKLKWSVSWIYRPHLEEPLRPVNLGVYVYRFLTIDSVSDGYISIKIFVS